MEDFENRTKYFLDFLLTLFCMLRFLFVDFLNKNKYIFSYARIHECFRVTHKSKINA